MYEVESFLLKVHMRGFQPFLFGLNAVYLARLCGDKVSLSDRPWMSSYIMKCVS
jgi:hypothetical protein